MLTGKKILLAVTGSIAAYKTAFFVRLLIKSGAEVRIIMTAAAKDFISPLTLSTLSKNPVMSDYFDTNTGEWNSHVELGLWADMMIVAPLTANTLAKLANGLCDNLVTATYLSAKCPVLVAPAMDLDMYLHPTTRSNLDKLKAHGVSIIDAEEGELASGLSGEGRLAEPERLHDRVRSFFNDRDGFTGKTVLITSGPTQENIDPVRFISNHSSGKMGTALARTFLQRGAKVLFITGPANHVPSPHEHLQMIPVHSAVDMYEAVNTHFSDVDIAIFAAAVADYRMNETHHEKIKRNGDNLALTLIPNPDIASEMGKKKKHQFTVGFALETSNEKAHAFEKLRKKNFDLIVLNSLKEEGAGFSHDTNKVSIFDKDNNEVSLGLMSKDNTAMGIADLIADRIS